MLRIAVCGKGGSGKSMISGALARQLAQRGHQVIAVDADPNPNLGISLGVDRDLVEDMKPILNAHAIRPPLAATCLASCGLFTAALGSSHSDAPLIKQDPQANLTDVYAFVGRKHNSPNERVLNVLVSVRPFSTRTVVASSGASICTPGLTPGVSLIA